MQNLEEKKATLIILSIIIVIVTIITIPVAIISKKAEDKNNFPNYNEIDITEKKLENENTYATIKDQLENDYYFKKILLLKDYDYEKYSGINIEDMLWNFIYAYEIKNTKYFTYYSKNNGVFCLSKKNILEAFKELYNVNIENELNLLPGYFDYVYESGSNYCFLFNKVSQENDNEVKVSVERLAMIGEVVTTDVYVYEFYTTNTDEEISYMNSLDNYIKNDNYEEAKNIVNNNLAGSVTHKQLQLKINNNGKFFKYQILSSKILDY